MCRRPKSHKLTCSLAEPRRSFLWTKSLFQTQQVSRHTLLSLISPYILSRTGQTALISHEACLSYIHTLAHLHTRAHTNPIKGWKTDLILSFLWSWGWTHTDALCSSLVVVLLLVKLSSLVIWMIEQTPGALFICPAQVAELTCYLLHVCLLHSVCASLSDNAGGNPAIPQPLCLQCRWLGVFVSSCTSTLNQIEHTHM